MSAPLTREEITSATARKWPAMTRADLATVADAIIDQAAEWGMELVRVYETTAYVAVTAYWPAPAESGLWLTDPDAARTFEQKVIGYVHQGYVGIANLTPGIGYREVRLSLYDDDRHFDPTNHDVDRASCPECYAVLPITGTECSVCGWEAPQ
jgi:hypothetical protein